MHPAQVAQLVEQRIENPRVGSSILSLGTIFPQKTLIFKRSPDQLAFDPPYDPLCTGLTLQQDAGNDYA